ncbi:MAG: hypothetical protein Q8R44_15140 [Novosphingobium sp.]|nr:hypothetical protein [Novosphingobium sp.]
MSLFRRLLRRLNPLAALGDLGQQLSTPYPHRFKIMAAAAVTTVGLFSVMWQEGATGLPHPPKITYVQSFDPGRSEAEIVAGNIAATKAGRAAEAEQAASAERIRQMYKTLGRVSGMDVDKIEAKAKADAAAEGAAKAAGAGQMPKARVERINP